MNSNKQSFYNLFIFFLLLFVLHFNIYSQCEIEASVNPQTIYCGQEAILTAFGSGDGTVMLDEDFNSSGFGPGWSSTPGAVMWNNPCSPGGVDGTPHAWMGNNTTVPRDIVTTSYDLSGATAGVTICFDLLFASQGDAAPCEGPDEPDEGVYLQYSTDGGATWVNIHYFDPNGGNDPQLTNWNNWCFAIPSSAITTGTQFRWHQTNDSGQDYDHWGIDNVEIVQNDVNANVVWGSPGDPYYHDYGVGSPGGENPNTVAPTSTTTYTVSITTGSGDVCTDQVTVTVIDPVYEVNVDVNPSPLCAGDCADLTGSAVQVIVPGGIETYENSEYSVVTGTPKIPFLGPGTIDADMNINIQNLNSPTVLTGPILEACLNGFTLTPGFGCSNSSLAAIKIILECPDGTQIILADVGDLSGNNISDMCFATGGAPISSGSAPYTGSFSPKEPFTNLNGCTSNGVWKMKITGVNNETCVPLGGISGWSITFDDPPVENPVDAIWSPSTGLTPPTITDASNINTEACPTTTTTYNLTVSNGVPGCATHTEPVEVVVDPCTGCTPPDLTINTIQECSPNTVDLNDAIDPSSDPANSTFYNSQSDATSASNAISNSVTLGGSYWVRAEDPTDPTCFNVYEITVEITTVTYTISNTDPSCGNSDGEIVITPGTGTTITDYSIDNGTTTQPGGTFSNLNAGTYTILITDANGCEATGAETLTNTGSTDDPSFTLTNFCSGIANSASGIATPGGTFSFVPVPSDGAAINPSTGAITNGVGGTTYTIKYETSGTCSASTTETVTVYPSPTYTSTKTDPSCGNSDGEIVITPNSGFTITTYSIDNGTTTQGGGTFSTLGSGSYPIVITDVNGCEGTGSVTLSNTGSTDDPSFSLTDFCPGAANNATITGTLGGTFSIITPLGDGATIDPTSGEITNGIGGTTYTIEYETSSTCSASTTEDVTVNAIPTFTVATTDPSCGATDGEIVITPNTGVTITDYSIDNGTTTQLGGTFSNLGAGSYTIFVIDDNGCEATATTPEVLVNTGSTDDPSFTLTDFCEGATNSANITGTLGGTFSIITPLGDGAIIDPSTGEITNGVSGTTYTIEYETSSACPASESHDVTVNATPTYTTTKTDPSCGNSDGGIVIIPGSGFTITEYSIDNGATTQTGGTFSSLAAGSYTIYIKDNNGCVATGPENLSNLSGPTITNISSTDASCTANDGTITVAASAGTVSYKLNNGQTSTNGIFTGLSDGNYTVTVTDANGCEAIGTVTVGKASGPTLTVTSSADVSCFGETDGNATINATGGTGTYTYDWSPVGGTAATATGLAPGTYTVVVKDIGGCSDQVQITISAPTEITVDETITNSDCGLDNGEIALNVTGGSGNYTYAWDPNVSTSDEATDLAVGNYEVTVTDDDGCVKTVNYNVNLGNSFYIEAIPDSSTILQGASVDLHLFVDPNITIDTIVWTPSKGLSCSDCKDPVATPEFSTTYIVTVTDDNGCTSTDTVKINVVLPCADIFVPNTFSPNSDGLNDLQCVIGECIVSLDFVIFNRWGETVFQTKDQKECWDGTFRGKLVQSGVYVYKLKATLEDGKVVEETGNVTVVR